MNEDLDKPTFLTVKDIEKAMEGLLDSEIKKNKCMNCGKDFFRNYSGCECDECYFSIFPKEQVKELCRSFLE